MLWINFLHFYQPDLVKDEQVIEAVIQSYQRLVKALKKRPQLKFTINISACLIERLNKLGYHKLLADIKELVKNGQLELVGSSAYHHPLTLLSEVEITRQIKLNEIVIKKYFGRIKLKGFFSPEMMYSQKLSKLVRGLGYEWAIFDEITASGSFDFEVDNKIVYVDQASKLKLVFRSREAARSYTPKYLLELLENDLVEAEATMITATDAELYGLRHNDASGNFEKLIDYTDLKTLTISDYLAKLTKLVLIKPVASSWESSEIELKKDLPYALWHDNSNTLQMKIWQLVDLATVSLEKHESDKNYLWSRYHLDRGLSSCTFWWASGREFKDFGGKAWNPEIIEAGALEIIKSIRSLENPEVKRLKIRAEKVYSEIIAMLWKEHWQNHWMN